MAEGLHILKSETNIKQAQEQLASRTIARYAKSIEDAVEILDALGLYTLPQDIPLPAKE